MKQNKNENEIPQLTEITPLTAMFTSNQVTLKLVKVS